MTTTEYEDYVRNLSDDDIDAILRDPKAYCPLRLFITYSNLTNNWNTPRHQLELADWLESTMGKSRRLFQLPRDHGKSLILCNYVVWRLRLDPNKCFLLVSANMTLAGENANFVREIIHNNPLAKHLRNNSANGWAKSQFFVPRQVSRREPSVQVVSLEGIVGRHADELIADDIEMPFTCETVELQKKLRNKIAQFSAVAAHHLYTGTPHTDNSIYDELRNKRRFTTLFLPFEDKKGRILWPDHPEVMEDDGGSTYRKFDNTWREYLIADEGENFFRSQFMLEPCRIEDGDLNTRFLQDYDQEVSTVEVFLEDGQRWPRSQFGDGDQRTDLHTYAVYWDIAKGKDHYDNSVVALVYNDRAGNVYIHRCDLLPPFSEETGFQEQCDAVVTFMIEHNLSTVWIETVGLATYKHELLAAAKRRGVSFNVYEAHRSIGKGRFIRQMLRPLLNAKRLWISRDADENSYFRQELAAFPSTQEKDDCIDAVAGAISKLGTAPVDMRNTAAIKGSVGGPATSKQKRIDHFRKFSRAA